MQLENYDLIAILKLGGMNPVTGMWLFTATGHSKGTGEEEEVEALPFLSGNRV